MPMTIDSFLGDQDRPSPDKIKKFLNDYLRLSEFEATVRTTHEMSAYTAEEVESFPDQDFMEVLKWLRKKSA